MRILFFSNIYPIPGEPTRGTFNADLVRALREIGHDVRCLVPVSWTNRRANRPKTPDATAVYRTWYYPPRILRSQYHRFMAWRLRAPFRRMTRQWHPDIIVAFWIHPDADVARQFARSIGVPVVAMAGGSDLLVLPRDRRRRQAVARVLQTVDGVITDGQHLANAAIELGADPARVVPFYRGVDARLFAPGDKLAARQRLDVAPDIRLLLAVGNLVAVKGIDILLDALAQTSDAPWHLTVIGDGPDRQALERRATSLGIGKRVTFVGRVAHDELGDWYRAADLLALPSRSEGVPNVLLEALACGTPYVATAVGGVAEITPDAELAGGARRPGRARGGVVPIIPDRARSAAVCPACLVRCGTGVQQPASRVSAGRAVKLPRNAQIWMPGVVSARLAAVRQPPVTHVWLLITDHFEPQWKHPSLAVARQRVANWRERWPAIAAKHRDDWGRAPRYTFFYPEEEYRPELLEPLAEMTRAGIADVEVHLHHDGEGEANFRDRMSGFVAQLASEHGLLRQHQGRTVFGFIHGNWALDNSHPAGKFCGLNNEITILQQLGCYADFTMPAAPSPCQTRIVNSIYRAVDDPAKPRSHDTGQQVRPGDGAPPGPPDGAGAV